MTLLHMRAEIGINCHWPTVRMRAIQCRHNALRVSFEQKNNITRVSVGNSRVDSLIAVLSCVHARQRQMWTAHSQSEAPMGLGFGERRVSQNVNAHESGQQPHGAAQVRTRISSYPNLP
jgi:hypothetical protein